MFKIMVVVTAYSSFGHAVTSQVIEFETPEEADLAATALQGKGIRGSIRHEHYEVTKLY